MLLAFPAVICFSAYFYIVEINALLNSYKDAAGIWHEDRFRPLVTAIANVTMNLIMVRYWGIYGVLLSTVLSMLFVGMPWLINNLFSTIFDVEMRKVFLKQAGLTVLVSTIVIAISFALVKIVSGESFFSMILIVFICGIVTIIAYYLAFKGKGAFTRSVQVLDQVTKRKLKLTKILN